LLCINKFFEFSPGQIIEYQLTGSMSNLSFIIIIVDILILLTDSTKTPGSLQDRSAKTHVIYDKN